MSNFEKLSLAISIVAFIVSLVSIIRAQKTQSAFLELEKVHAELSKKQLQELNETEENKNKTDLSINIYDGNMFICNRGNTVASEISLEFSNAGDDHIIESEKSKLPYPTLNPHEEIKMIATYNTSEAPLLVPIKMKWKNIDGTYSEYNGVLQP
ncbi:MAG: hypothetical protein HWE10_13635 [Gammaproteobacteria bacterium]|nr:hypothetical protein [Gammaproteobacteria bacterium]